jgi:class 3 adenylate cyclase
VKKSVEVESVVRRFLEARVDMDMEAMLSLHSGSEHLRLIGSDEEWLDGRDAVVAAGSATGESSDWVVTDSEILRIEAFEDGPVGWAAVAQQRTLVGGQTFVLRGTMVLRLESSVWKVIQLHFSLAVPDDEVVFEPVSLPQTVTNLLGSIDDAIGEAMSGPELATATVMFTDVVDSTPLSELMGDEEWSRAISDHFRSVNGIVEDQGGWQVKTLGDGGMYVFRSATAGVRAAKRVQRLMMDGESSLPLRIGLHTGDLVPADGDFVGLTVNVAARIAATAVGGQVFVSSTTQAMVRPNEFDFDLPVRTELKGLAGVHTLYPLGW